MSDCPLPFAPPGPADVPWLLECTQRSLGSDCAAANIILLQEKYHTTVAACDGFLFRHYDQNSRLHGYAFPTGEGDVEQAIHRIRKDAIARDRELRFCLLTAQQCDLLQQVCPGEFRFTSDRGDADYLYRRDLLAELPGTPYHAKRNHISRFTRDVPEWSVRPLGSDTTADALHIAEAWLAAEDGNSPALRHELRAITRALELIGPLQLFGLILFAGSKPAGMAIGSLISPQVADVHYEKCTPEFRGAYPLLNREFARALSPDHCTLINREEDLNSPGLRKAKLSYHPELILEKHSALPVTS